MTSIKTMFAAGALLSLSVASAANAGEYPDLFDKVDVKGGVVTYETYKNAPRNMTSLQQTRYATMMEENYKRPVYASDGVPAYSTGSKISFDFDKSLASNGRADAPFSTVGCAVDKAREYLQQGDGTYFASAHAYMCGKK